MKYILILLTLFIFGCNDSEIITIEKPIQKYAKITTCYKMIINGQSYTISSLNIGDTIEYHRGIVAYIPCNSDTTSNFDLSKLVIVDTVGYAKTLLDQRRIKKFEEDQKLRVNL